MEIAVIIDVSVFRAIAGRGFLSKLNLDTNSAEKCWACAALPPLPAINVHFCLDIASIITFEASITVEIYFSESNKIARRLQVPFKELFIRFD